MSAERFTLDTNVLIYFVDGAAGERHQRAIAVVEAALEGNCWLTLQSLSEFYAAVTRKRVMTPARAAAIARDWLETFPAAAPSADAVRAALADATTGRMSYWDALLVSTAAEAGCTAILTEDLADGSTLRGVRVLNPFAGDAMPAAVRNVLAMD